MGNRNSHQHNIFTRNWLRIAPSFLRNTMTNQLIQEHDLRFDTYDQQSDFVALINKRMANHHPHVVKVLYYKIQPQNCNCICNQKRYSLLSYTQYQGPSLAAQIQSKTVQNTSACNCLNIITVLQHLQHTYGNFEINQYMMFMNLRPDQNPGQKTFKLWINSKVQECRRERPCTQHQMCLSIYKILKLLANQGQCKTLQIHQLSNMSNINTLSKLRQQILALHTKRKKVQSFNAQNSRPYGYTSNLHEIQLQNRKKTIKANSMPQKIDMVLTPRFHNASQVTNKFVEKKLKNAINQNISKNITYDVGNMQHHRNIFIRNQNLSPKHFSSSKINFSYSKNIQNIEKNAYILSAIGVQNIHRPSAIKKQALSSPKKNRANLIIDKQVIKITEINNKSDLSPSQHSKNNEPTTLVNDKIYNLIKDAQVPFQTVIDRTFDNNKITTNSSPIESQKQLLKDLLVQDIEITIDQIKYTPGTEINPTTSRTPIQPKEYTEIHHFNQIQKPKTNNPKKNPNNGYATKKDQKNVSINSSSNKFQKYSQALKDYQQKIKRKNSNRQNHRDKNKIEKKINKLVVPGSSQSQFKETHSIYNQSVGDADQKINQYKISQVRKQNKSKTQEEQSLGESIQNGEQKLKKADQQKLNIRKLNEFIQQQGIKQKQEDQQKAKQMVQKQELQRDLQKEKKLIQKQMEGLLLHNHMKEQYRSIREKVKQKKQTFAQLKAEAAKILQDLAF